MNNNNNMGIIRTAFLPIKRYLQHRWKSIRFNLSAQNNALFLGYYRHIYRPKKGSLSAFLSEYSLLKKDNFTVIQIGANDGITHDPIHKFIKRDNWNGVLLEPLPDVYNQYLKKIYLKNSGIETLCAAIGEKDGTQPIFKIGFSDMRWATGLTSFSRQKIESAYKNGIVASNCLKFGLEIPEDRSQWISQEEVEVISPKTLLSRFKISEIDLIQIDAEGYDLEVIRIFDIINTKPGAIIFENVGLEADEYESCLQDLNEKGYKTRKFGPNTLALRMPGEQFEKFFI